MAIFSLSYASLSSTLYIIAERVPVEKEKDNTPISIRMMQNNFSSILIATMSPYPTVKTVVTVKYIEQIYKSE